MVAQIQIGMSNFFAHNTNNDNQPAFSNEFDPINYNPESRYYQEADDLSFEYKDNYRPRRGEEAVQSYKTSLQTWFLKNNVKKVLKYLTIVLLLLLYLVFFVVAMILNPPFKGNFVSSCLFCLTLMACVVVLISKTKDLVKRHILLNKRFFAYIERFNQFKNGVPYQRCTIVFELLIISVNIILLLVMTITSACPRKYYCFGCIILIFLGTALTSKDIFHVDVGLISRAFLLLQLIGVLTLRVYPGNIVHSYILKLPMELTFYTKMSWMEIAGKTNNNSFLTKVPTAIIGISALTSLLYYHGIMQKLIRTIGEFIANIIRSSPIESFLVAAHMFFGIAESGVLIEPFLSCLTPSEITTLMTSSFATIALSIFNGLAALGIPTKFLATSSLMSAPATLVIAKMSHPEILKSRATRQMIKGYRPKGSSINSIDAFLEGAKIGMMLSINLVACLLAVTMAVFALDDLVHNFIKLIGGDGISFRVIVSYIFYPISYMIGIYECDNFLASKIIGISFFINENYAFNDLASIIKARKNFSDTGKLMELVCQSNAHTRNSSILIHTRSIVTTIHAACGFMNIGSIGVLLSVLGAIAPNRKSIINHSVARSFICAILVNLLNATLASIYLAETSDEKFNCSTL